MSHKLTHGFRAKARLRSVFADSKVRVITLARRSKKPRPQQWKNYPSGPYRSLREKLTDGFFEWKDFLKLVNALPEYLRALMKFAYFTGWRMSSEVLALRWPNVDFEAGTVKLEPVRQRTTKDASSI